MQIVFYFSWKMPARVSWVLHNLPHLKSASRASILLQPTALGVIEPSTAKPLFLTKMDAGRCSLDSGAQFRAVADFRLVIIY